MGWAWNPGGRGPSAPMAVALLSLHMIFGCAAGQEGPPHTDGRYVGCFKGGSHGGQEFDHVSDDPEAKGSVERCLDECAALNYRYAGLQNGESCRCGRSYGRHGPGQCDRTCGAVSGLAGSQASPDDRPCGGEDSVSVYSTGVAADDDDDDGIPGVPARLRLERSGETNLTVSWEAPEGSPSSAVVGLGLITTYHIYVNLNRTFDSMSSRFTPKHVQLSSDSSLSNTIIGLAPGTLYNVTVAAASAAGTGPGASGLYWTEIGDPAAPEVPTLLSPSALNGQIRISVRPVDNNPNGPVTAYRIVVIDETHPAPFHPEDLADWATAVQRGLPYYVAAELGPEFFFGGGHEASSGSSSSSREFVLGDLRNYGGYWNHGPLLDDRDYHVTVGTVSTWRNVTKVSYAKVGHDQHGTGDDKLVVFNFGGDPAAGRHAHGDDGDDPPTGARRLPDETHRYTLADDNNPRQQSPKARDVSSKDDDDEQDVLVVGLTVAIVLGGFLLVAGTVLYLLLRKGVLVLRRRRGRGGSGGESQELTAAGGGAGSLGGMAEAETGFSSSASFTTDVLMAQYRRQQHPQQHQLDDPGDTLEGSRIMLDRLRSRTWAIPRNFLELNNGREVVGRGRFGSVVKASLNTRQKTLAAAAAAATHGEATTTEVTVQVVPWRILSEVELRQMVEDLELNVRCGSGGCPNLVQLLGLCDEKESTTILVAFERADASSCLKQVLLDSRALYHQPVFANQNKRISTLSEVAILDHLVGLARAMHYLFQNQILHRRLLARNVFLVAGQAKVGGFGIVDFASGPEFEVVRWTAQEALRSSYYVGKCDTWSFGVLMWELCSLGATPYPEVKSKDVATRVMRGLRPHQTACVSDRLYQLMLQCWQLDLDERPDWPELEDALLLVRDETASSCSGSGLHSRHEERHLDFSLYSGFKYDAYLEDLEIRSNC